uniref:Ig-like domain-containing protein n=1 Tax=Gadus morhua TaxID=8049 RepID=A0A8C5B7B9_GADMO
MSDVMILFLSNIGQLLTRTALVGEDASLSYDPKLSKDLTETPVKCYTDKMIRTNDFVFKKDKPPKDNYKLLNPAYRGRTRLSDVDLKRGIFSLRLHNVTRADEDNYYFVFPSKRYKIQLLIGENATSREDKMDFKCAVSSATITLEKRPDCSGLVLRCESVGWYPQPQLSWWTDGGLPLPAVTMNTTWDPTGLYTISSTVVVESQGARNYICRVHQERSHRLSTSLFNTTSTAHDHIAALSLWRQCTSTPPGTPCQCVQGPGG